MMLLVMCLCLLVLVAGWHVTRRWSVQAEQLVPQAGDLIDTPLGTVHIRQMGSQDGPPLVLIHGLYGQMQHLGYALAGALEQDYRLYLVDRPGCGYSPRNGWPDPAEQGAVIQAALDQLGVARPILVGHSLGGAVAVEMALARPDNVRALALLAPAVVPVARVPLWLLHGMQAILRPLLSLVCATLAAPVVRMLRPVIRARVFAPERMVPDYDQLAGSALGVKPMVLRSAAQDVISLAATAADRAERIARQDVPPGGVLFGDSDRIVPPVPQMTALAGLGWSTRVASGRGHMIPLTDPETCAALICDLNRSTRR